ncbi:MAG TPA: flagellar protein FlgN [Clostridiales bacterium]|nr:flagellar protein FlgN [Clostridiales bacterium]
MASLLEELIGVLDKELDLYQNLIPVSEEKTRIIVRNDLNGLQEITAKEQAVVDSIRALERRREEIMANIKTVLNRKSDQLNLGTLIQILDKQPEEQKKLSALHDNLKNTIGRLTEINARNKTLIEQSLEMIEFNMNFIQSTRMAPGNNTYTRGASQYGNDSYQAGMFDAKQ